VRELREDVLHPVCATQGPLLLSGMQCQNGSSQKRKRIQGSKRILGRKEKVSAGLLIASIDTRGKNIRKAVAKLFCVVSVDSLSVES
jgi:hypothetical protein